MIQALVQLIVRAFIGLIGVAPVMLELRRVIAGKAARESIVMAIGTMQDIDDGGGVGGEGIEARGIGFGEYLMPECECEGDDDDDE